MTHEQQRVLWLSLRRACLLVAGAIGRAFGIKKVCPHCGRPLDKLEK